MKKLSLLLVAIVLMACSKDDIDPINENPNNNLWTFYYKEQCSQTTPTGHFCVSKQDYDIAMSNKIYVNETCFKLKFKDSNGNIQYYIFQGSSNICND